MAHFVPIISLDPIKNSETMPEESYQRKYGLDQRENMALGISGLHITVARGQERIAAYVDFLMIDPPS